jgi:hypothetical protein
MTLIVERARRVCLSGGIRGIRGYSITGNTQSLHLCIGSSNLPTSITSMTPLFSKPSLFPKPLAHGPDPCPSRRATRPSGAGGEGFGLKGGAPGLEPQGLRSGTKGATA